LIGPRAPLEVMAWLGSISSTELPLTPLPLSTAAEMPPAAVAGPVL